MTSDVRGLFEEVRRGFPIEGYLEDEGEGHTFIASQLAALKPQGGRLLDVGCGPLDKTALFSLLGFECYACDDYLDPWHRRPEIMRAIRDAAEKYGITLHVHQNGDYRVPFDRESFEIVTILGVIEHLHESPREILNTAGTLLKDGGIAVIVMPNAVNIRKRLDVVRGQSNFPDVRAVFHSAGTWRGHVREYTLSEAKYIMTTAGFEVVRAATFDSMVERKIKRPWGRAVYRSLIKLAPGMRDSLFVAARKPPGWRPAEPSDESYRAAIARSVPAAVR